jgi:hypothetical protein
LDCYQKLTTVLIAPGLGVGGDESRAEELTNVTATDSQSVLAVLHNSLHPDLAMRPAKASAGLRFASYVICGALTLLTFLAARRRHSSDPLTIALLWGGLIVVMTLLSPVCHLHYFCLCAPLVMCLLADCWERQAELAPGMPLVVLLALGWIANLVPLLPKLEWLRDFGMAMYAALALWLVGVVVLWRRSRLAPETSAAMAGSRVAA